MILRVLFLFLSLAFSVGAVDMITATVTVTNAPNGNTNTITVNGSTRTWTNSIVASPSTLIQQTNTAAMSATNLLNHLTLYPGASGQIHGQTASTNIYIRALPGRTLTVTIAGGWAGVTYATNTVTDATVVRVPITVENATNQTNIASLLINALNLSTNALATNAIAGSNYLQRGAGPEQVVSSAVSISSAFRARNGFYATNGFTSALTNINPVFTNGINYGNAFRSPGTAPFSEQFGSLASASGGFSVAVGYGAVGQTNGTAVGYLSSAGHFAVALGSGADSVTGTNSIAIGQNSTVAASSNAIAIGKNSFVNERHHNSVAIGYGATTGTNDQIVLGASTHTVLIAGLMSGTTQTNSTFRGTNVINGRVDLTAGSRTSLANGYNSGTILGTNVYLRMSGPTAAYTNAGFAAGVDGTWHKLQFDNPGLSYTVLHDSGLEATAANRIYTGTGALVNSTNNPVFVELIYDANVSRWRLISIR